MQKSKRAKAKKKKEALNEIRWTLEDVAEAHNIYIYTHIYIIIYIFTYYKYVSIYIYT